MAADTVLRARYIYLFSSFRRNPLTIFLLLAVVFPPSSSGKIFTTAPTLILGSLNFIQT